MSTTPCQPVAPLADYSTLSERLSIPVSTLRSLVAAGRIPHLRIGPRTVRFDLAEVEAWLRQECKAR